MFHLGSPDVLPVGDLGVRRGMQQLYGLKVRAAQSTQGSLLQSCLWSLAYGLAPALQATAPVAAAGRPGRGGHGADQRVLAALPLSGILLHVEGGRAA